MLSQKSLNIFQRFAALYWIYMERRKEVGDIEDTLRTQVWYLNPDRYFDLFAADVQPMNIAGEPIEEPVTDIDEIDRWFDGLDQKRSMSGAQLFGMLDEPDKEGWI